ncbi:hypothetical protein M3Y99_01135900 [Aphelenchoides fujianensis]|nr:hypothetical protein M3Y99_01135900 [Aphelenchoides fujianensis]
MSVGQSVLVLLSCLSASAFAQSAFAGRYFATAPVAAMSPPLPPGPGIGGPCGGGCAPPPPIPVAAPPLVPAPIPVAPPPPPPPVVPVVPAIPAYAAVVPPVLAAPPLPAPYPAAVPAAIPAAAPGVVPAFSPGFGPWGANKQEKHAAEEAPRKDAPVDAQMAGGAPFAPTFMVEEPLSSSAAPVQPTESPAEAPKEMA